MYRMIFVRHMRYDDYEIIFRCAAVKFSFAISSFDVISSRDGIKIVSENIQEIVSYFRAVLGI